METCPHGARIVTGLSVPIVFIDECRECSDLLADLNLTGAALTQPTGDYHPVAV